MSGFKAWIKKWWKWLLAGLGVLLTILTAGIIIWEKKRLGRVKDQLTVERATSRIKELRALRESLGDQLDEKDQAMQDIDTQLKQNKLEIIEAHEGSEGMSDEEMLAEFDRLGI